MSTPTHRKPGRPRAVRIDSSLIRDYRERVGMSREELADVLGVTSRTLQRAENDGLVSVSLLEQVCHTLRLPVAAMLRPDGDALRLALRMRGLAPAPPPPLTARASELERLRTWIEHDDGPRRIVIDGPIGVGKTSLAQALAHELAAHFENGIVWVSKGSSDVRLVQRDIASALAFDAHLPSDTACTHGRDWTQAFVAHFWRGRRMLVLDDVTDESQIAAFLPRDHDATLVVTTRFRHVGQSSETRRLSLRPLADAHIAALMLDADRRDRPARAPASFANILTLIGGIPALALVARAELRRASLACSGGLAGEGVLGVVAERVACGAVALFADLESQISRASWRLFAALGLFGTEPVPLSCVAAAAGAAPEVAQAAASELLDVRVVELHRAPDDDDEAEPWLRLAAHSAAAARALALATDESGRLAHDSSDSSEIRATRRRTHRP